MSYYKKIIGKKCYLSPLNPDDADKYTNWLNDPEVSVHLSVFSQMLSLPNEREFLDKTTKEGNYIFGIIDIANDQLIGNCGLVALELIDKTAEYGIFIGDKSYWGKGYGEEATNLMLDYAFNVLNLNNIMLRVFDYNKRGIKCYEKCGFKTIGRRRESKIIAGKKIDVIYMDIIADEFASPFFKTLVKDQLS
jgi:RimJ/RimL family protein N-acetyltransferase